MISCNTCGNVVQDGTAFCTSCGALTAPVITGRHDVATAVEGSPELLTWDRKIPLITIPWLVLQCIAIPIGIALVFGTLFSLITESMEMLSLFLVVGGGLAVLLVLYIVTGGELLTIFFISDEGVAYRAGSTTRTLDRIAARGIRSSRFPVRHRCRDTSQSRRRRICFRGRTYGTCPTTRGYDRSCSVRST